MYLRTPEVLSLAGPTVTNPCANPPKPPLTNGGQFIRESDADKVLTIVSGPSPYQKYILPVMQGSSKLPKKFFRIVSSPNEVPAHLRGRFATVGNKVVGGTIDRPAGTIYMLPPPGRRGDTRLEFALHEAVHVLAHPFMTLVDDVTFFRRYGTGCIPDTTSVGSFQRKYCFGLGEGATQVITEQIMNCQGISRSPEQPYKEFLPPVLKLIEIFSLDKFARAYFWGAVKEFTEAMEFRWGGAWRTLADHTTAGDPKQALALIDELEKAYFRKGRDYPTLPRNRSYA